MAIALQAPALAGALVEALCDKEREVRRTVMDSLIDMARKQLEVVLRAAYDYLWKHGKLPRGHRILILNTMEKICIEHIDRISTDLASSLIDLSLRELTQSSDVIPEWQTAACNVLTTLGLRFADKVLKGLLSKFPPGGQPHYFVVRALGLLSTANAKAVVPSLNVVIARMLPMLSQAKHDNMQWVFSSTIALFCESILEYLADKETAAKSRINEEGFEGEIYSAYEHLVSQWLLSKESKLRVAVIGAVGFASKLLSPAHLNEQIPKLIPTVLNLYKKHSEHYPLSQCMCNILEAAFTKNALNLEMLLDSTLLTMHGYACIPVDMTSQVSIRNQSELLRCFTVLTNGYSDKVISFLMAKLGEKEKIRLPTLNILKHIINSCEKALQDKRALIVNGLKILLAEPNLKIRSVFAQTIISMASHRYLEVEGGHLMVEFVLKECAITVPPETGKSSKSEEVTPKQLREMNDHVIRMMTTTVPHTDKVLWPYLLEFLTPMEYHEAASVLTRCIAHIGTKKREGQDEDYLLNYEAQINLPKPEEMIARLFVLAGHPDNGRGRGEHVLQCFLSLGPNLAPPIEMEEESEENPIVKLWDTTIPRLLSYLEEQKEKGDWNQKSWEDLLLKLLIHTLDAVGDEEWTVQLGTSFGMQIPSYNNYPEEKGFAYKCLGVVMKKSAHKDFVKEHLDLIFSAVKHTSQVQREGCAFGYGYCASEHLDPVMLKLEQITKDELGKKSKGFFGFGKDKSDAEIERIKSTVMLCYGYVTFHSPAHLITSRVEVNIWRNINPHFTKVKDTQVKENLIRTMDLIGRSMHPDHLKQTKFIFQKRPDVMNHLLNYIKEESPNSAITTETRSLCMDTLRTLVKLEPQLTEAEQFEIVGTSLKHCLAVPPLIASSEKKARDASFQEAMMESARLTILTHESCTVLLTEILLKDISSHNFENIFKHLEVWLQSSEGLERKRAIEMTLRLLHIYKEKYDKMDELEPVDFIIIGHLLGRLVPRTTDPEGYVRETSLHCIQIVLRIGTCEKGQSDKIVDAVTVLMERSKSDDATSLFTLVSDLGKVLYKKMAEVHLWNLTCTLMEGLLDLQAHSSNGACVVLNSLLKQRGTSLQNKLSELLDALHNQLEKITNVQTRTGTLRCVRTLGVLFTVPVVTHLLGKALPFDSVYVLIWQSLAADPQLVRKIFDNMLETLMLGLPYQEKTKGSSNQEIIRMDTPLPRAITAALTIIFKVEEVKEPLFEVYHKFLPALLARIGNCIDLVPTSSKGKEASSISLAKDAFREFLLNADSEYIAEALDYHSAWGNFDRFDTFPNAVMVVAGTFGNKERQRIPKVVEVMALSLSSVYENQRIMVVSFFAQLILNLKAGDVDIAEQLMNFLLGRQVDSSFAVRKICIQGLGNIADIRGEQISKFSTTVLSALMAGMDDREDPYALITMEAMSGLAKVFERIEEGHVRPILINISLRIRPCFEKELPSVRAAAFNLFGSLARFSDGPSRGPFLEQIQTNFIMLLLHLNEEDPTVVMACKFALKRVGPLLKSAKINELFQNNLEENSVLLYGEFLNSFCKQMGVDFPDKMNFYVMDAVSFFKHQTPHIRGNAALFVGFALGHLPEKVVGVISKEHISEALILLLKDPEQHVRCCSAEAISMLHRY